MKTKYYCEQCDGLFNKKEIGYKYTLNLNGKTPVVHYICKECGKGDKHE